MFITVGDVTLGIIGGDEYGETLLVASPYGDLIKLVGDIMPDVFRETTGIGPRDLGDKLFDFCLNIAAGGDLVQVLWILLSFVPKVLGETCPPEFVEDIPPDKFP